MVKTDVGGVNVNQSKGETGIKEGMCGVTRDERGIWKAMVKK